MKLYDAPLAPSPRRVRIFLAEKGIEVERVMIDMRQDEQLGENFLALNPRGAVPALLLDDGELLTESVAICRYFEALHPDPPLFGTSPIEIARIESWTRRIEQEGYAAIVYGFRNTHPIFKDRALPGAWPPVPQIPELAARGRLMWDGFLDGLERQLSAHEWIAGDRYSFADIMALVTIDFCKTARFAIPEEHRAVRAWHARLAARPSSAA